MFINEMLGHYISQSTQAMNTAIAPFKALHVGTQNTTTTEDTNYPCPQALPRARCLCVTFELLSHRVKGRA